MHRLARSVLLLALSAGFAFIAPGASAQSAKPPSYAAVSAQTREVAERYFQAYLRKDWASLEPLLADEAQFRDTTAALVFGSLDQPSKAALMRYFRQVYPYIETHEFKLERSFFAGEQAVFVGVSDWSFSPPGQTPVRSRTPIVIAVQVKKGQVVEHLEMGDLQSYVETASRVAAQKP